MYMCMYMYMYLHVCVSDITRDQLGAHCACVRARCDAVRSKVQRHVWRL